MSRSKSIVAESFLDGFTGAGLFGRLRWPGKRAYLIDYRGLTELEAKGEMSAMCRELGVEATPAATENTAKVQEQTVQVVFPGVRAVPASIFDDDFFRSPIASRADEPESNCGSTAAADHESVSHLSGIKGDFCDKLLTCVDCRCHFVFTAGEQIFFLDKQLKNEPKRCKPCKAKRALMGERVAATAHGIMRAHCSECHAETTVPFKPTQGRPVLCRQCFQGKRLSFDSKPPEELTTEPSLESESKFGGDATSKQFRTH